MTIENSTTACISCGAFSKSTARFCSECGKRLGQSGSSLSVQAVGLVLLTATFLWAAAWTTQRPLLGTKPTQTFDASANRADSADANGGIGHEQIDVATDPQIEKLRKEVEGSLNEPAKLQLIASALVKRYREMAMPSKAIALELIDTFSAILKLDPKNSAALLGMAEVSFDQQAFPKAVEFYERYLKLLPGDTQVRQRYAASLTFVGRPKDSIAELEMILKDDPKNFSASAYLAIAYAEDGQFEKAIEVGDKTLAFAPSDEARERFGGFLNQLKTKGMGAAPDNTNVRGNMPAQDSRAINPAATSPSISAIEAAIKHSPIAAPKFVRSELKSGETLVLYFKDFPMEHMPLVAKDKFLGRIREASANVKDIKKISFVDLGSGKEVGSLDLSPAK